jgi:branched-subunit amino acid transport protein
MKEWFPLYLAVMAGVTYLIRMLPLVLCKKKIQNRFVRSFLYYIPYAVLAAMTVPAVFYATESALSAWVGFGVAVLLSARKGGLLTVAVGSAVSVYLCEWIMRMI